MEFFRRDSWVFSLDFGISDIQTGHTGSRTSLLFFFSTAGSGLALDGWAWSGQGWVRNREYGWQHLCVLSCAHSASRLPGNCACIRWIEQQDIREKDPRRVTMRLLRDISLIVHSALFLYSEQEKKGYRVRAMEVSQPSRGNCAWSMIARTFAHNGGRQLYIVGENEISA